MMTRTQLMIGLTAMTLSTGCYMNPPPGDGRGAPVEEQPAGEYEQPEGGEAGEEGEVPPPAPGAGDGYEDGEQNVPVDPGPRW